MELEVPDPRDEQEVMPSLGGQVCEFIKANLVHGPGDLRGQPARLDQDKEYLIWRMYEVYPRTHPEAGRRRWKRAALMLPKGCGKTELAAWIAATELHPAGPVRCIDWDGDQPIGGGVIDPYIPMVAYTEEQSDELAYGALKAILEESWIADDFDIGLERILRIRGDGKAVSLAGSPSARDGARTTFAIYDETHWWTLQSLKDAHRTMQANLPKRYAADAWALETTTAPEPGVGSVAERTLEYAQAIKDGKTRKGKEGDESEPRLMFYYRFADPAAPLETEEQVERAVREASGPTAVWRDIRSIVAMFFDPTSDTSFLRRVWLNQVVQSKQQAFDINRFRELATDTSPVSDGDLITLGFDGARKLDATGLVATHVETGYQWPVACWERPLNLEDWEVPRDEVDLAVADAFDRYTVWRMYADPWQWDETIDTWIRDYGKERVVVWTTGRPKAMSEALESYRIAIETGSMSHSGDDDLVRHLANARRHELNNRFEQGQPRWLIFKERPDSPKKIDLAMAAVLSWEARNDAIAAGATAGEDAGVEVL